MHRPNVILTQYPTLILEGAGWGISPNVVPTANPNVLFTAGVGWGGGEYIVKLKVQGLHRTDCISTVVAETAVLKRAHYDNHCVNYMFFD